MWTLCPDSLCVRGLMPSTERRRLMHKAY
jgi:hypothetical protein